MIVRKLIVSDGQTERELLLVGTIVVGRDPACQLNDLDPLLSRRHAEFISTKHGVTIRDLKSRNGILVNGEKVPEHALKPGDMVQLGHLHLRYVEEAVVKTPEDHTRSAATTDPDIEMPTMAPVSRPRKKAPAPAASAAPTAKMPTADFDKTEIDMAALNVADLDLDTHPLETTDADADATVAPVARPAAPSARPVVDARASDDGDATRVPGMNVGRAVQDLDATRAPSYDETRAPVALRPAAPAAKPAASLEARVVANASLIVTEASPNCHAIIGARPETIVGGQLAEVLSRGLTFVATGDGPSSLSVTIARAASGKNVTITFRAGQATENHS